MGMCFVEQRQLLVGCLRPGLQRPRLFGVLRTQGTAKHQDHGGHRCPTAVSQPPFGRPSTAPNLEYRRREMAGTVPSSWVAGLQCSCTVAGRREGLRGAGAQRLLGAASTGGLVRRSGRGARGLLIPENSARRSATAPSRPWGRAVAPLWRPDCSVASGSTVLVFYFRSAERR